jgi:hypothetical protein
MNYLFVGVWLCGLFALASWALYLCSPRLSPEPKELALLEDMVDEVEEKFPGYVAVLIMDKVLVVKKGHPDRVLTLGIEDYQDTEAKVVSFINERITHTEGGEETSGTNT